MMNKLVKKQVEIPSEQGLSASTGKESSQRFHDLDSLRASMMLLGVVFHAAWFFVPVYFGHTLSDVSGAWPYLYFFAWVHQFRMQVFFLIAGFFACLLIQKRGDFSFFKNRMMRVVVPFLLAMLTLYPLMKLQLLRGGLISGRILSDEPLWTQYWNLMTHIDWKNEWVVHLWFLHTLILVYAISLVIKVVFQSFVDRRQQIRNQLKRVTHWLIGSLWGPFVLAIPLAACLAYDLTWFGIDSGNLYPLWAGVFAYWFIFAVGWCLYSKPELIDGMVRRWPTYLVVGSLISLLLCGYFQNLLTSGRIHWFYPAVLDVELDYPVLRQQLLSASQADGAPDSGPAVIWNLLSPAYQQFLRERENPNSDQISGFAAELTGKTVMNPEFAALIERAKNPDAKPELGSPSQKIADDTWSDVENRRLLTSITSGAVVPKWDPTLWIRVAYFYAYALATWLMTFAMLGLFRRFLSNPSPTVRYLADSSYWVYLIHLPIQFELSLYIATWEANSVLKFLIYNLLTVALSFLSYHYLVRPTWLGWLLNGRLYPLRSAGS